MRFGFLLIFLFSTSVSALAQDAQNPWFFGIGYNAIDYQTHAPTEISSKISALRLSAGRIVMENLSAEISFAQNTIYNFAGFEELDYDHSAIDFTLWYSLQSFIYEDGNGLIDPYIGAGAGSSWLERSDNDVLQNITFNGIAGVNFWIKPKFAIVAQGAYKHLEDDFADPYYEYVLGIRYTFNFNQSDVCFP